MSGRIPKVVVIGSVYVDMAVKCSDFPRRGKTVEGTGFSCLPTGPGLNRAVEVAHCGCETYLISKVGDDHFGKSIRENVSRHGVNSDFLYTAQAISTGIIVTLANSLGENSSCISTGANRALSPDEIACASAEQLIGSSDVCLIHDDLPVDVVITAIRMATLYSTKVVLEAQLAIDNAGELKDNDWPAEYYSANILIPHFDNTGITVESGAGNVHKLKFVASELVAGGIETVVVKIGSRGTLLIDRQGSTHIPAFDLDVLDQSASDEAFAGALAASFGSGDEPKKAVRFASAAGALAASKFGSQDTLPTKEEIIELLQKQPD